MSLSLFDTYRKKKLQSACLIFLASCVAFYTIIYMPLYYLFDSNISFAYLSLIWTQLIKPIMEYTFYWGSFTFVLYGILRYGVRRTVPMIACYAGAAALRYICGIFSYMWIMGAIHWSEFMTNDFPDICFSILMDWLQMTIVLGLTAWTFRKICKKTPALGKIGAVYREHLPFEKIFEWSNPLFQLITAVAAVPAVIFILERLYYDWYHIFKLGIEVSTFFGVLEILLYYAGDVLTVAVGAILIPLLINTFCRSDFRAATEEEKERENQ